MAQMSDTIQPPGPNVPIFYLSFNELDFYLLQPNALNNTVTEKSPFLVKWRMQVLFSVETSD